ncbi:MAG: 1,4-dihydroxy-2-naphthoate polyprenyltransferase [Ignavibacteriae bacterium HGW-Ignavibacteriae-2]|jgi:1,4-dihydroxy-2-naphthoate octaprenyltransferase|nr:1,4-dihydroxy-2-naphthoate polyprenyltransferase [Bacteroidota bacterium]PKL90148.1 MAG: 1,4-dihydroxy-2-naphthoate polyprenyltransferase [Ignavibacteriae bacterium HGW-Ignavibacteriae-2]
MILSSAKKINKLQSWILASRPKTLPAAFVPVAIGSALAYNDNQFNAGAVAVALICSFLIQIGTNFVNDLYDFIAGTDKKDRVGPTRVLASGLISVNEMKIGISITFSSAFILGMYLVYISSWITLIIGIVSIIAGFAYTAGPFPLAYNGLGDVFVFLFFGFVGTIGTYYVQTLTVTEFVVWASVPVGALITNILVINNYRDIDEDRLAGKNTLAVKFGRNFTRFQYVSFMILSYLVPFIAFFTYKQSYLLFLPLITIPLSIKLIRMIYIFEGKELNKTLELTAKLSAIYGILFAIGILV